jgi:hypothetical protein
MEGLHQMSDPKGLGRWSRVTAIAALLAALSVLVINITVVSLIDASVVALGGAFTLLIVIGAVFLGYLEPGQGFDTLWQRLALGWVASASKSKLRLWLHLLTMGAICVVACWAGIGSIHLDIRCSEALRQGAKSFSLKNWFGRDFDVPCKAGTLAPVWIPFLRQSSLRMRADSDYGNATCLIGEGKVACTFPEEPADFSIPTAIQEVDFQRWRPVPASEKEPTSFVDYKVDLGIKRLVEKAEFLRWVATNSVFLPTCRVSSGNGSCLPMPDNSYGEIGRRVERIAVNGELLPLGQIVHLQYDLAYGDAFLFMASSDNGCVRCDITFVSRYPVKEYRLHVRFPQSWTYERIVVNTNDDQPTPEEHPNKREAPAYEFDWHNKRPLRAGARLAFNIYPAGLTSSR